MTREEFEYYAQTGVLVWLGWNVFSALITGINNTMFGIMGSRLIRDLRIELFQAIIYK